MFELVPKLYVLSAAGIKLLLMPATIDILSVASSPIVILPPMLTSPVTSKSPVITTLFCKLIWSVTALKVISPLKLSIVFPLIRKLPVSILSPLINVLLPPVVNVTPLVKSIFKALTEKLTVPSSWFT